MPSPQPLSFDARALTEPVDPRAVRAFSAAARAGSASSTSATKVITIVVASFISLVFLTILIPTVSLLMAGISRGGPLFMLLPVVIIAVIVIGGGLLVWFSFRNRRIANYRLSRFAAANNMTYAGDVDDPPLPGMIFTLGRARKAAQLVRGHSPRFVEFGNYQYTTGSGKNSTTHKWGYVAVKLDVPLPNIVLDALGNNAVFGTNLPASFQKEQRLSLEGDFDKYFTLYCPAGYEQDALYLFTPDIMARFIDNAAQLDVEIVDDWLFLYTKREASTLDPNTWAWLFGAVGALITKFDQWARWRDDRLLEEQGRPYSSAVAGDQADAGMTGGAPMAGSNTLPFAPPAGMLTPPPGVARQGRRLKRSGPWVAILVVALFAVGWIFLRVLA
ncbi:MULTISPECIES: hypothetical protein [Microbacterium]|uniref:DUF3137 domain-containing protein n=1 Tax=Microbacterium profundi TaxID=450380 RepID=A0ABV3LIP8_9MICO|nr:MULTISPECIES: hypothetical protein [Microbacterium]MCE7481631.1 DUF3137 domain-containing protein [Microbacterium profundi]